MAEEETTQEEETTEEETVEEEVVEEEEVSEDELAEMIDKATKPLLEKITELTGKVEELSKAPEKTQKRRVVRKNSSKPEPMSNVDAWKAAVDKANNANAAAGRVPIHTV